MFLKITLGVLVLIAAAIALFVVCSIHSFNKSFYRNNDEG